jgi:hypothetical protein
MAKYIAIELDGNLSLIRRELETGSEDPLTKEEKIINHLYDQIPQWVNVEDRLPEDYGKVQAYTESSDYYRMVWFSPKVELFLDDDGDETIATHWMPLPQPPKPEEL